ncbi:MAG: DNA-deoxyinosine glycosylase [Gemmatimonadales bacterium]|nr:MAG: DNA-deoxyinosine glycosylase [Gemmatimonadales bacterium]
MPRHRHRHRSFPPLVSSRSRVLVLGSLPGAESLAQGRYYAHPRNRFWPVLGAVFGVRGEAPWDERLASLDACGVALWDVLGGAARVGSLDTSIVRSTEEPNDVAGLLAAHPGILRVGLNGRKAEALFLRWVAPQLAPEVASRVRVHPLPSTSPANARFRLEDLVRAWAVLR